MEWRDDFYQNTKLSTLYENNTKIDDSQNLIKEIRTEMEEQSMSGHSCSEDDAEETYQNIEGKYFLSYHIL